MRARLLPPSRDHLVPKSWISFLISPITYYAYSKVISGSLYTDCIGRIQTQSFGFFTCAHLKYILLFLCPPFTFFVKIRKYSLSIIPIIYTLHYTEEHTHRGHRGKQMTAFHKLWYSHRMLLWVSEIQSYGEPHGLISGVILPS